MHAPPGDARAPSPPGALTAPLVGLTFVSPPSPHHVERSARAGWRGRPGAGGGFATAPTPLFPLESARRAAPAARRPAFAIPFSLALAAGPTGRADVRLRLFELRVGTAREGAPVDPPPLVAAAARAGALLAAHVAAPDVPLMRTLAAVGAVRAVLPTELRRKAGVALRLRARRVPRRVTAITSATLDWIDQFVPPSLALASAGALLALAHPPSAAVLKAAAAAITVAADYASVARAHSLGRLRAGAGLEAAWRARHRAAARALAPHLADLPATPPLAWLADAWDAVSTIVVVGSSATPIDAGQALSLSLRLPGRCARLALPPGKGDAAPADPLALYGAADHEGIVSVPAAERLALAARAAYLAAAFLPFLLLAPLLLAAASAAPPTSRAHAQLRSLAWLLLLAGVRASGPAFCKWAQWSATREDMFPVDLCRALATLHDAAPTHSWRQTEAALEAAYGRGAVARLFASFDRAPLASGSVAQVHVARLKGDGGRAVAVKVAHPGVANRVRMDFALLKPLAAAASTLPGLRGFSLQESLAQFSATMTAQADLRVEAAHVRRFGRNFASVSSSVVWPTIVESVPPSASVLVESFERGDSVTRYMRAPAPFNPQIVALGVDAYLKMLLADNFVHTDLHPGNILVRVRDGSDADLASGAAGGDLDGRLQLVLLDAGLAEQLTPTVRTHFVSMLNAIMGGDGGAGARHMLAFSADQRCPDRAAFTAAMEAFFDASADVNAGGIDLDAVLKGCLRLARAHSVSVDSSYAALLVGVVVIVAFGAALDPETCLADAATPALLAYSLTGRSFGRLFA